MNTGGVNCKRPAIWACASLGFILSATACVSYDANGFVSFGVGNRSCDQYVADAHEPQRGFVYETWLGLFDRIQRLQPGHRRHPCRDGSRPCRQLDQALLQRAPDGCGPCGNREAYSIHAGAIEIGNDERPFARSFGRNQIHPPRCSIVPDLSSLSGSFYACGQPGNISAVRALLRKSPARSLIPRHRAADILTSMAELLCLYQRLPKATHERED